MKKRIGTLVILALILLFGWMGFDYLHYRSVNAVSDAAFIKSDRLALLAFKVDGKVIRMDKEPNAPVKKGEILAQIDPKDFILARKKLRHEIAALEKSLSAMRIQHARIQTTLKLDKQIAAKETASLNKKIKALSLRIAAAKSKAETLHKDALRYKKLLNQALIAPADYEKAAAQDRAAQDEIAALGQELAALRLIRQKSQKALRVKEANQKKAEELAKNIQAQTERLAALTKALEEVDNQIGYTTLKAPFDGIIAKKFIDAPRVMEAGTPVYALTDPQALYCEVLLSEKKMEGVHPGCKAVIKPDALKGKEIAGTVESIAPTSAATFSLVPRDIASGEFTKLDQRFAVRIRLESVEGLRAGMGATVAIKREE
ncbi:MAG: HlyD family efflux transporter periplasmic adaptor subunit [Epsilonproteobacteria bacterium]|nr:HlyD family efflux transporter periplasmic adaptor subunit [Campylobacterota bacterium]